MNTTLTPCRDFESALKERGYYAERLSYLIKVGALMTHVPVYRAATEQTANRKSHPLRQSLAFYVGAFVQLENIFALLCFCS